MAKNDIKHSCGHWQTHQLLGPMKERDRKKDWLATTLCTDCWRKERDSEPPKFYARWVEGGVEIIATQSYAHREVLRGRGYKFGEYVVEGGLTPLFTLADRGGTNGWARVFRSKPELRPELDWIDGQGWTIRAVTPMPEMVARLVAVWEGRPDLAPADVPGTPSEVTT